jgi:hypothetical protein
MLIKSVGQTASPVVGLVNQAFASQGRVLAGNFFLSGAGKKLFLHQQLQKSTLINLSSQYGAWQKKVVQSECTQLHIPGNDNGGLEIKLVHHQITAPGFVVKTSSGKKITDPEGINNHFFGIVAGDDHSIAAFSFNKKNVTGFFSNAGGNNIIEPAGKNGREVLYREKDINLPLRFTCAFEENSMSADLNNGTWGIRSPQSCKTVRLHIECTYAMYQQYQSNLDSIVNFVFTLFNASATIFKNDGINILLSEIFIWDQPDIFTLPSTINMAEMLRDRLKVEYNRGNPLNADVAHLITPANFFTGYSTRTGLNNCGNNTGDYSCAASSAVTNFPALPTYSFSVFVFTHETGHLLGSPHTQSCSWPGGPIDNCVAPEGNCTAGPAPVNGGTIMSYCHVTPYGINFLNGFGPLPSALIRNQIELTPCISSCNDTECANLKVKQLTTTLTDTTFKIKWKKESIKYRIGIRPGTAVQWNFYEVANTDSFIVTRTKCDAQFEYSIAPYCPLLDKYGTVYASVAGKAHDTIINKQVCFGQSFEGHFQTSTYVKKSITAAGCDSITTINLTVNNDIAVTDSLVNPVDNTKGKIFITSISGGLPPYHFLWNTGDTSRDIANAAPGNYSVTITDSIGCRKIFIYQLFSLSISKDYVILFPNPARENAAFTVRIGTVTSKMYNCIIYDVAGKKIWEQTLPVTAGVNDYTLTPQLHTGIYLLHMAADTNSSNLKFIIQ